MQFGATCFGMSHAMLKDKMFDVCIIDEAGQVRADLQGCVTRTGRPTVNLQGC